MKLTDILNIEEWTEIEKELNAKFGLNASVFDADGNRVTTFKKWANQLCPLIKSSPEGASYICAVAHQDAAAEAARTKKAVISGCDAGFVKIVAPIIVDGEFLGVLGGCGLMPDDGEVDTFLISKTIKKPEDDMVELLGSAKLMSAEEQQAFADYLTQKVEEILSKYKKAD